MTRTQRYERGWRMTNRILELQQSLKWSQDDVELAVTLMDDAVPINLHDIGKPLPVYFIR
jgi:acyl-CoA oxidase